MALERASGLRDLQAVRAHGIEFVGVEERIVGGMCGDDNEGLLEGVEPLGGREAEHSTETLHERLAPSTHTHTHTEREREGRGLLTFVRTTGSCGGFVMSVMPR